MGSLSPPSSPIPIIDIRPSNPTAASDLLHAAATHGFVYIENNAAGIPPSEIEEVFSLSKTFFASPIEEKETVAIASNKAGKNHGWLGRGVETLDPAKQKRADVKEAFNMGEPLPPDNHLQQPLPPSLAPHTRTLLSFQSSCQKICLRLLQLFALALEIEPDWFTSRHEQTKGPTGTVLRLLYYPCVDDYDDAADVRAGAHSDFGSVTLLFQQRGEPGLEIRTEGGEWVGVPVDPAAAATTTAVAAVSSSSSQATSTASVTPSAEDRPLPILVNIGDLLEDWTDGLLKSTVHRVVFPQGAKRDRYSIAYFCHALEDVELEAVPSEVVWRHAEKSAAKGGKGEGISRRVARGGNGKVLTAKDHLMERLGATYSIKA